MWHTISVSPEDEAFLFQVYASTRAEEVRSFGFDEATAQAFLTMQWTAQKRSYEMQDPHADHRLIIYQNFHAGRIMVSRSEQDLSLVDLSLLPAYQNLGIGTALLLELQKEASDTGRPLRLSVLKTNPARRLYERLGFVQTGDNGLYNSMEWRPVDFSTEHST